MLQFYVCQPSAGRSAIVSRLSSDRLKILLQIYLISINLEQYGSLEKSHRENEVHSPLNAYNSSNHPANTPSSMRTLWPT